LGDGRKRGASRDGFDRVKNTETTQGLVGSGNLTIHGVLLVARVLITVIFLGSTVLRIRFQDRPAKSRDAAKQSAPKLVSALGGWLLLMGCISL